MKRVIVTTTRGSQSIQAIGTIKGETSSFWVIHWDDNKTVKDSTELISKGSACVSIKDLVQ